MNEQELRNYILALYPWAERLGILDQVVGLVRDDASPEEILAHIRQTDEWKAQFPAFYAEDGSRRFANEAAYLTYVDDIRDVMKEFGVYDPRLESPANYVGLIEWGIDPNELENRYTIYRSLENGTQELRDAFYVYAGLEVTVDDVYRMTVDPDYQASVVQQYDQQVAMSPPDYETYITRVTERALEHLVTGAGSAVDAGLIPAQALQRLVNLDPNQARVFLDALVTGAPGPLAFDELNRAFQYAMLGSAASGAGLELPTRERLAQFLEAGATRAQAQRAYTTFASQRFGLAGMAQRAGIQTIDQTLWEEALLLQDARAGQVISKAQDRERAFGAATTGFGVRLEGDRITQSGR